MPNRYLALTELIAASLALSACAGGVNGGTALQKSLGPGGRGNLKLGGVSAKCLQLGEKVRELGARDEGAALHSRDYDLGKIKSKSDSRLSFETVKDKASQDLLTHRSLTGANAPVYLASDKASEVLEATPATELLGVEKQDGCSSVKFKNGTTFAVTHGTPDFLSMTDKASGQVREYSLQGESLTMTVFAPVSKLKNCDGSVNSAKTERISTRLTWGKDVATVSLTDAYAKRLGLAGTTNFLKFESNLKALPAKATALNCNP